MIVSGFEENTLILSSAGYIENTCSLWELGGSWILNLYKSSSPTH